MNMTDCLDITSCSLAEGDRRFRGACCLHHHDADNGGTSETSVKFYENTRRHIPESCHLRKVYF
jgi:hypothetical protein